MGNDGLEITNVMDDFHEKLAAIKDDESNVKVIQLRIKRLKEDKEKEINDYVDEALATRPNFFTGYGEMVRRDLSKAYEEKEKELNEELFITTNKSKYESAKIKNETKEKLLNLRKKYEGLLNDEDINFSNVLASISNFKYEYDEQGHIINGASKKILFDESNGISDKMRTIRNILKLIEESLNEVKFTEEEADVYSKINSFISDEKTRLKFSTLLSDLGVSNSSYEANEDIKNEPSDLVSENNELNEAKDINTLSWNMEPTTNDENTIEVPETKEEVSISEEASRIPEILLENPDNYVVDTKEDLAKLLYSEIMSEIGNMRSIELTPAKDMDSNMFNNEFNLNIKRDSKYVDQISFNNDTFIELPNGEYVNSRDFNEAVDRFSRGKTGKTYVVRSSGKNYKITNNKINKFKKALAKSCVMQLSNHDENSLTILLKPSDDKYLNEINTIENVDKNIPNGRYIYEKDLIDKIEYIFSNEKLKWLKNLKNKLKNKKSKEVEPELKLNGYRIKK